MYDVNHVAQIVQELQNWIEDHEDLSTIPTASFTYGGNDTLSIQIGSERVWFSDVDGTAYLTVEDCKARWLEAVACLRPFVK